MVLGISSSTIFCQNKDSLEIENYISLWEMAYLNNDYDAMELFISKARDLSISANDLEFQVFTENGLYYTYNYGNKVLKLKDQITKTYDLATKYLRVGSVARFSTTSNYANYLYRRGDILQAVKLFEEVAGPMSRDRDNESRSIALANLATCYAKFGDYDRAHDHVRKSIALCENDTICYQFYHYYSLFEYIALFYLKQSEFSKSLAESQFILEGPFKTSTRQDTQLLIKTHLNIAEALIGLEKYSVATESVTRAIKLQLVSDSFQLARSFKLMSHLQLNQGRYNEASRSAHRFKKQLQHLDNSSDRYELVSALLMLVKINSHLGNTDSIHSYFQQAFHTLDILNVQGSLHTWVEDFQTSRPQLAIDVAQQYLIYGSLSNEYERTKEKLLMTVVPELFTQVNNLIERPTSLLRYKVKLKSQYAFFIDKLLELYEEKNDIKYLNKAINYSFSLKNSLLREDLIKLEIAKSINNKASYIASKESLKAEKRSLKKSVREKYISKALADSILFEIEEQIIELTDSIRLYQPELFASEHSFKFNDKVELLRDQLGRDNGCILDYFETDSILFIFKISADGTSYARVPISMSNKASIEFVKSFITHSTIDSRNIHDEISELQALYNVYVKPILTNGKELESSIFVLPDGGLNAVPLELLVKPDGQNKSYHDAAFILRDHTVSYLLFADELIKESARPSILRASFYSPSYENMDDYISLDYKTESNGLNRVFDTDYYIGDQVSPDFLRNTIAAYNIVHIAAHAKANIQSPAQSVIYMSAVGSNTSQPSKLFAEDFYDLSLNADLVVLSACETGNGKEYSGEGVYSFSRYFISSGAKSVVHNLWKADDFSTSSILAEFYSYLSNGYSKPEALRHAKLAYLKNADNRGAHPYYWASLVAMGSPDPLVSSFSFWPYIIGLLLVLGLFLLLKFRKKK